MLDIRPYQASGWRSVWAVLAPTFRSGETCAYPPEITEAGAHAVWIGAPMATFVARGFRAMQFNLVVSTNEGAIRLWKKHGFAIVAVLPGAFRHRSRGFVDALVMYKQLET